ncbi:MAG: hypothetical protein U0271_37280 [Polyangiaceae bacterium]
MDAPRPEAGEHWVLPSMMLELARLFGPIQSELGRHEPWLARQFEARLASADRCLRVDPYVGAASWDLRRRAAVRSLMDLRASLERAVNAGYVASSWPKALTRLDQVITTLRRA